MVCGIKSCRGNGHVVTNEPHKPRELYLMDCVRSNNHTLAIHISNKPSLFCSLPFDASSVLTSSTSADEQTASSASNTTTTTITPTTTTLSAVTQNNKNNSSNNNSNTAALINYTETQLTCVQSGMHSTKTICLTS
uniref:Uncharacterized protein n=1 Tax=Lygus hesperus TaxID=30085 RepID=A0A0A9ZE06_LYGHE